MPCAQFRGEGRNASNNRPATFSANSPSLSAMPRNSTSTIRTRYEILNRNSNRPEKATSVVVQLDTCLVCVKCNTLYEYSEFGRSVQLIESGEEVVCAYSLRRFRSSGG